MLQVVHGFPPRESAGTERYAAMLADGLRGRGHLVHTFAATVDPARPMYSIEEAEGVTRVVNNLPGRETRTAGRDAQIDRIFEGIRAWFRPDLIHVQHLAGLSTTLPRAGVPTVWTLHDAWAWCAAGGTLLRDGGPALADGPRPCDGPGGACARCASAWMHDSPRVDRALGVAAGVGRFVRPDRLHRAWQVLPAAVRARVTRGAAAPLHALQITARSRAFRDLAAQCVVVAPSRFFARLAEENGIRCLDVVPHGLPRSSSVQRSGGRPAPGPDAPFVFVGTLARHKGPDLVRSAWELAGRPAPLRVHGPQGPDPAFRVANDGPLDHADVAPLLAGARALVLGSTWPENAPLVVLEARAVGCPVIAPDSGGIPEIVVDGIDGWLYPAGDVSALAERLLRPLPRSVRPAPTLDAHLNALLALYERATSNPVTYVGDGTALVAGRPGLV